MALALAARPRPALGLRAPGPPLPRAAPPAGRQGSDGRPAGRGGEVGHARVLGVHGRPWARRARLGCRMEPGSARPRAGAAEGATPQSGSAWGGGEGPHPRGLKAVAHLRPTHVRMQERSFSDWSLSLSICEMGTVTSACQICNDYRCLIHQET